MKAQITDVAFEKEYPSTYDKSMLYQFKVYYNDKWGYYSSKKRDQAKFVKDKEAEFNEIEKKWESGEKYLIIKPIYNQGQSNYSRAVKKEQSRYAGFAMAYSKDLCVAGKIELKDLADYTKKMFSLMVDLDKSIEK